jgi:hypothetical protein
MRTFLAAMLTLRVRFIKRVDFHKITSKMVLFGFTGGAVLFLINRTYLLQKSEFTGWFFLPNRFSDLAGGVNLLDFNRSG